MTFWQDNYYPYYKVTSTGSTNTETDYETEDQLRKAGCYTWNRQTGIGGPSATAHFGHQMTLRATADSRYRVRTGHSAWTRMTSILRRLVQHAQQPGLGDYQEATTSTTEPPRPRRQPARARHL